MSGKDDNFEQFSNKLLISLTLLVSHLDISGKAFNDLQSINNYYNNKLCDKFY